MLRIQTYSVTQWHNLERPQVSVEAGCHSNHMIFWWKPDLETKLERKKCATATGVTVTEYVCSPVLEGNRSTMARIPLRFLSSMSSDVECARTNLIKRQGGDDECSWRGMWTGGRMFDLTFFVLSVHSACLRISRLQKSFWQRSFSKVCRFRLPVL